MDKVRKPTTKGVRPSKRKLAVKKASRKLTGNQWQNTPQQNLFMSYYMNPESETFSNAYESALKAKYSIHYATQIASPAVNNKWIQDYKRNVLLTPEHVKRGITHLATKKRLDSRSPDDTRLNAFTQLGKFLGMEQGQATTINIVQPILGGASVQKDERIKVDIEQG